MSGEVQQYSAISIPNRSDHLWRYTSWQSVHPTGDLLEVPIIPVAEIRLLNLDGTLPPSEVTFRPALPQDLEDLSSNALSTSEISSVFLREVAAGRAHLLDIPSSWVGSQALMIEINALEGASIQHLLINVGKEAQFELTTAIRGKADWFGLLREISVGKGAVFRDLIYNRLSSTSTFVRNEGVDVSRDACFNGATLSLGGNRLKTDLRHELLGSGAELSLHVGVHGNEQRQDDHHFVINHPVGQNQSKLVMHSACDGRSKNVGTGRLVIAEGAQSCDAGQVFKNLLLSDKAEADSIPELEVFADDVSAAHGAASAPLDPEQLFYLESRGLGPQMAKDLLTEGFLMDAFTGFKSESLVNYLRTRLLVHLDCDLIE
jgi:Fe-S cluster assembly protein SufD